MKNNFAAVKYALSSMKTQTMTCFLIIILNIIISFIITKIIIKDPASGVYAGSLDIIAFIWFVICGLVFFKSNFKIMLANSITRKKYFGSTIQWMIILAAIWAVGVAGLSITARKIIGVRAYSLYEILYSGLNLVDTTIWSFSVLFFLIVLGWAISMLYYRSNKIQQYIISLVPFVLSALITLFDSLTDGSLGHTFRKFIIVVMGFSTEVPNPYIGAFSLLTLAIIVCAINYLLVRRAEIKE